ncbi:HAD family hydrolase [Acidimangrovimonas sediminis]|uniref:HAD family hydrolase n=1 Tax=Acidimangrovimonas sediminis TaxID=2056283 RepID=UPI000C809FDF|nr:HAD family hydrolase [Acidimangrovimonas sediminis]
MIAGILFDKDGTLFDFNATWGDWTEGLLHELASGDPSRAGRLASVLGYDTAQRRFAPDSIVVAHTPDEVAAALLPHLPGHSPATLVARMNVLAAQAPQVPAFPLGPLLADLRARGLKLGVATNDAEEAARAHLASQGVTGLFDFVAGFDSGYGGKPHPGMLLAFADRYGLDPAQVVMVGDSLHDLIAGRAAGMRRIAVLTGLATEAELGPLAEAVLPDIGHLPDWLDTLAA